MSLATNQAMCMLAVASGCMETINEHYPDDPLLPTVLYVKELADNAIIKYPATGDPRKNLKWMEDKVQAWSNGIRNLKPTWVKIVLTQMPLLATEDLLTKLRNPQAVSLVQPVTEALRGLSDALDPEGDQFDAYEEAEKVLYRFYHLLDFHP